MDRWKKLLLLTVASLLTLWAAWPFLRDQLQDSKMSGGDPHVKFLGIGVLAAAKFIAAGICFALAYVDTISLPFTSLIDGAYGTRADKRKPPLDFAIADRFLENGMRDSADLEYRRLLDYYPRSLKIWKRRYLLAEENGDDDLLQSILAETRRLYRFDRERRQDWTAFLKERASA